MFRILFASAAFLGLVASSASAHVVFAETQARAGAYYAGFLRVSHGCGGSPTIAVRVDIPESVNIARPQPKPGWVLDIARESLATPIQNEGGHQLTERVAAIMWRGELPADQFDQFGVMMRLPHQSGPLYFRVTQICAGGEQRWHDIPAAGAAWNSVPYPAAVLYLSASTPAAPHRH